MELSAARELLEKYGQTQLLDYYDELTPALRASLLMDIGRLDFSVLDCLGGHEKCVAKNIAPMSALTVEDMEARHGEFDALGLASLKRGEAAAVILSGGQGSRLGIDAPKGTFNIGVTRELSIFECLFGNIEEVAVRAGRHFHVFVMTSPINDAATREFFKAHSFFGYPEDKVHFYVQNVAPACSADGKFLLAEKHKPVFTPNGNGGWYSSLVNAGYGALIAAEGIKMLNVFSVDNVLQRICDPVFIGAMLATDSECASKVVSKTGPEERVGVMCLENGRPSIVEYYELSEAHKYELDGDKLAYRYGVTLNYLYRVDVLERVNKSKLPYHLAFKAIPHIENGVKVCPDKPNGYKFESLTVDMIRLTNSCIAVEVIREKEFAPVKNMTGVDSVESARKLLELNGVKL